MVGDDGGGGDGGDLQLLDSGRVRAISSVLFLLSVYGELGIGGNRRGSVF